MIPSYQVLVGDCREVLGTLAERSVHTVVTSPPYFGLRDYGTAEWEGGDPECSHTQGRPDAGRVDGIVDDRAQRDRDGVGSMGGDCRICGARRADRQIGLEPTPDEFVSALVSVFREVRRVLRDDGTVWLNLGDSYAAGGPGGASPASSLGGGGGRYRDGSKQEAMHAAGPSARKAPAGYKPKDLLGIPWMVAFALRADGWYLRSDVIWHKPNPMPESVTDRPTGAHEYVFLLSKSSRYFYDADAVREPAEVHSRPPGIIKLGGEYETLAGRNDGDWPRSTPSSAPNPRVGRNKRSVWTVATQPYADAHFAVFPPRLVEPCILAGSPERACGVCGAPWVRVTEDTGLVVMESSDRPQTRRAAQIARERGLTEEHLTAVRAFGGPGDVGKMASTRLGVAAEETRRLAMEAKELLGSYFREFAAPAKITTGAAATCRCDTGTTPGVVLDPFAGAGTTGVVAARFHRDFVGIELSPEYARMACDRIETDVRLGYRRPTKGKAPINGQESLFGDASGDT